MPDLIRPVARLVRRAQSTDFAKQLHRRLHERRFLGAGGMFHGVYPSYDAATAALPPGRDAGYDHPEPANMYLDRHQRVYPADYPVLFHLQRLMPELRRIFDFGGHLGVARYAYARYLDFPSSLEWTVCDVPAVVERGRALAAERGMPNLHFTAEPADATGTDLWMASGSIQYLQPTIGDLLGNLAEKPRWVLINKTPLHKERAFWTIQNLGSAFCPYAVFKEAAFEGELTALGYTIRDRWQNGELSCQLPAEEGCTVSQYSGLLAERV